MVYRVTSGPTRRIVLAVSKRTAQETYLWLLLRPAHCFYFQPEGKESDYDHACLVHWPWQPYEYIGTKPLHASVGRVGCNASTSARHTGDFSALVLRGDSGDGHGEPKHHS